MVGPISHSFRSAAPDYNTINRLPLDNTNMLIMDLKGFSGLSVTARSVLWNGL